MQGNINVNKEVLTKQQENVVTVKKTYNKTKILLISYTTAAVILILSLVYNYNVFSNHINPVSDTIENAISNATENFEVYTFDNQIDEEQGR